MADQVKPAPNATNNPNSPCLKMDAFVASSKAIGIDAAEVFPYLSKLQKNLSNGMSNR